MAALAVGTRVDSHTRDWPEGVVDKVFSPTKVSVKFGYFWITYTYRAEHDMWVQRGTHVRGVRELKRIWVRNS